MKSNHKNFVHLVGLYTYCKKVYSNLSLFMTTVLMRDYGCNYALLLWFSKGTFGLCC